MDDFAPTEPYTQVAAREDVIGIRATTFAWSEQSHEPSARAFRLRIDEVTFEQGNVNLVVGPTGSGKTALLLALLGMRTIPPPDVFLMCGGPGEMHAIPNGPGSYIGLPRSRGVAYVAQESWVLSDTIKVYSHRPYVMTRALQPLFAGKYPVWESLR